MKYKTLILLLIAFSLSSCYRTYLKLNGIRNPTFESQEDILRKCKHYDKSYPGILCFPKDTGSFHTILRISGGVPKNLVFNRKGELIIPGYTGYCAGKAMKFALSLDKNQDYLISTKYKLDDIRINVFALGDRVNFNAADFDFTIVIFWADFLGKGNRNVFEIMEEMKRSDLFKMNYILVNMDAQKSWNMISMPYSISFKNPKK